MRSYDHKDGLSDSDVETIENMRAAHIGREDEMSTQSKVDLSKATPGPTRCANCEYFYQPTTNKVSGIRYCSLHAAAPELLAALFDCHEMLFVMSHSGEWKREAVIETLDKAGAALKLAEGEQP